MGDRLIGERDIGRPPRALIGDLDRRFGGVLLRFRRPLKSLLLPPRPSLLTSLVRGILICNSAVFDTQHSITFPSI